MAEQNENSWKSVRNWVVGVTSVLVVLPSLFNAALDIYNIVLNIPRTAAEENNTKLFAKHFNQEPVVSLPVPVRQGAATYEARFSIYPEGDIYVQYGDMTQWFPFPTPVIADTSLFNPIASAYADEPPAQVTMPYKQTEAIDGTYLIRNKEYADGVTEKQVIDMTSGKIVETQKGTVEQPAEPAAAEVAPVMAAPAMARTTSSTPAPTNTQQIIAPFAVVDLNAIQATKGQNATAILCKTVQGNCTLLHPVPTGSECICSSSAGELKGTAQ